MSAVVAHSPMREKVLALQAEVAKLPQVELPTNHYFADGVYVRELFLKAGTTIVGKIHKREHIFMVTKGSVRITVDDGVRDLVAPVVIVGKPGTKRAAYAIEDCVCVCVHGTNKKNLRKIEKELIEPEEFSLFDSANKLKVIK